MLHVFIICVIQLESKWTQTSEWFKWLECVCVGCSVWRVWSEVPFSISSHQSPVPSSQQVCASDFDLACTNCSIAHLTLSLHICLLHIPESIKPWNPLNPLTLVSDQDRTSPYQLRDYLLIQYQILQTNILMRIIWQTVRRIANEILGVKGSKGNMNQNCSNFTPKHD